MAIQIINTSNNPLPAYETAQAAGMDLRAFLPAPITLGPLERTLVPTGLFIALEEGTEAQIRPRSGVAFKQGVTVLNSPGTIDADYRGELKVLLVNLSNAPVTIQTGDRIAQMVIAPYLRATFEEVSDLPATNRGAGGFGSTGVR